MGAFLSVGKGSSEPSIFLEMKYFGAEESDSSPLIFVGKGKCSEVTFDFVLSVIKVTLLYYLNDEEGELSNRLSAPELI